MLAMLRARPQTCIRGSSNVDGGIYLYRRVLACERPPRIGLRRGGALKFPEARHNQLQ